MRNGRRLRLVGQFVAAVTLLGGCLGVAPFTGPADPRPALTPAPIADPSVLVEGSSTYVYGTNWLYGSQASHVPVLATNTGRLGEALWQADALPNPPAWTTTGEFWAPSVAKVGSTYLLFYSALNHTLSPPRRCLSVAKSPSPLGPFVDPRTAPIVCMANHGGAIDPFFFADSDGRNYLLWKTEGVVNVEPTMFWSRELTAGGASWAAGSTDHTLLATAQPWEGTVIENPAMVRSGSQYWLFYSANNYDTTRYAIGVATCASPMATCARTYATPILASRGSMAGPGGPFPYRTSGGSTRLAYSAWKAGQVAGGYNRFLFTLPLSFTSGAPSFG